MFYVYIYRSARKVLYIGKGKNLRWKSHLSRSELKNKNLIIKIKHFGSEKKALAYEKEMIKKWKPLLNIVHNDRIDFWRWLYRQKDRNDPIGDFACDGDKIIHLRKQKFNYGLTFKQLDSYLEQIDFISKIETLHNGIVGNISGGIRDAYVEFRFWRLKGRYPVTDFSIFKAQGNEVTR